MNITINHLHRFYFSFCLNWYSFRFNLFVYTNFQKILLFKIFPSRRMRSLSYIKFWRQFSRVFMISLWNNWLVDVEAWNVCVDVRYITIDLHTLLGIIKSFFSKSLHHFLIMSVCVCVHNWTKYTRFTQTKYNFLFN